MSILFKTRKTIEKFWPKTEVYYSGGFKFSEKFFNPLHAKRLVNTFNHNISIFSKPDYIIQQFPNKFGILFEKVIIHPVGNIVIHNYSFTLHEDQIIELIINSNNRIPFELTYIILDRDMTRFEGSLLENRKKVFITESEIIETQQMLGRCCIRKD